MISVEQIDQGGGNIQTPPPFTEEDKGFQAKKYFFTYHIKGGETYEQAFDRLEPLKAHCKDYIWAEEHGSSGETPHIQGGFVLRTKARASTLGKQYWLNGVTLRKLKDWKATVTYCSKEGFRCETSEKIRRPLKKLACEGNLLPFQKVILEIISRDPCERSIYWFKGSGACGKTTFCKYLSRFHGAICLGGKAADMKNGIIDYVENNGDYPEIIVVNLPRSFDHEYLSYPGIEDVKDMYFYSGKYKGGMVDGNWPHLFIFSNEEPSDDDEDMSPDRWQVYNIDSDQWVKLFD